jgi:hypothetical protein
MYDAGQISGNLKGSLPLFESEMGKIIDLNITDACEEKYYDKMP